jgi:hypothetical protein
MLRRTLLTFAACSFAASIIFAVIVTVGVIRLAIQKPGVQAGTEEVIRLRPYGWATVGCAVLGFTILWFVRGRGGGQARE